jgi:hypothetical protein
MGFIFGMVIVLGVIALLHINGEIKIDFSPKEHEHDWVVRGAHQMVSVRTYHGVPMSSPEDGTPVTEVLYRCECGDVATETEVGHWTFEQLSGVAGSGDTIEPATDSGDTIAQAIAAPVDEQCSGGCPNCPHGAHPGVSCLASDSCGCGQ